ncbi:hypothetical protein SO802_005910 [Lithocarpus litseifolius]|uniref:CCHC-type domain-containing protein n=1 Tax=Lithocarpus litseifolius TaxID=425828 RepID=A0AAW2DLZ5_9ROSI
MSGSKASTIDMRCHHCAGPLSKDMETSEWTVPPLIRDSFSMIGSAVGGTTSAFYGFNHVMPKVRRFIMTNFNPLAKILDENRLSGPNYVDWKRNLIIVLTADKIAHVLNIEAPELALADATEEQRDAFNKWHEADEMAKCYIMASMTNVLQKQCQGLVTAQDMMMHLKEMFGEQSRSAWQTAMKNLMSTKMVEGTPVREHVLKMISFINELDMLGAEIDSETQVDAILASLPDSFNQFIMNYNMNKMVVTLSELLNMLKAAEDLIKKEKPTVMLAEKSDSSLKFKPKGKNFKRKGSQSFNKAQGDKVNKDTEKKKAKGNCFHCGKPGHWKRNCRHYLASLKNDKPTEGVQGDPKAK